MTKSKQTQSPVSEHLPMPLFHQIYLLLRENIVTGIYPHGSAIPSEHEIVSMFDVSRITAKRALDELADEGYVSRQRGRGTIVTYVPPKVSTTSGMTGFFENLLNIALETNVTILDFKYEPATRRVAAGLEVAEGEIVQHVVRIRSKDDKPFSYVTTYVPEDIGIAFREEHLTQKPLLALIEQSGVKISRAKQTMSATLADTVLAGALQVRVGSPLMKVSRTVYDENGRAVEYLIVHYRSDLYQLQLDLSRVEGEDANFWTANQ